MLDLRVRALAYLRNSVQNPCSAAAICYLNNPVILTRIFVGRGAATRRGRPGSAVFAADLWAESAFTYVNLLWTGAGTDPDQTKSLEQARASTRAHTMSGTHQADAWLLLAALASRYRWPVSTPPKPEDVLLHRPSEEALMPLRLSVATVRRRSATPRYRNSCVEIYGCYWPAAGNPPLRKPMQAHHGRKAPHREAPSGRSIPPASNPSASARETMIGELNGVPCPFFTNRHVKPAC